MKAQSQGVDSDDSASNAIKARCIVQPERRIKGTVLFTSIPIAFLQGVDPEKGFVSDKGHDLYSKSFVDKILVFPNAVGSSVGAYVIYRLKKNGMAPKAMINQSSDIITASGCAISGIPLFDLPSCKIDLLASAGEISIDSEGRIVKRGRRIDTGKKSRYDS